MCQHKSSKTVPDTAVQGNLPQNANASPVSLKDKHTRVEQSLTINEGLSAC